jgi:hypothetical protein
MPTDTESTGYMAIGPYYKVSAPLDMLARSLVGAA